MSPIELVASALEASGEGIAIITTNVSESCAEACFPNGRVYRLVLEALEEDNDPLYDE